MCDVTAVTASTQADLKAESWSLFGDGGEHFREVRRESGGLLVLVLATVTDLVGVGGGGLWRLREGGGAAEVGAVVGGFRPGAVEARGGGVGDGGAVVEV